MTVLGKRAQIIFAGGALQCTLQYFARRHCSLSNIHLACDVNKASDREGCHDFLGL
jgi:hypothetical protein